MNSLNSSLPYFSKVASGKVPADGEVMVKRAIGQNLISRHATARFFGVQEKQVMKISGNLKDREVREFCSHILELHQTT